MSESEPTRSVFQVLFSRWVALLAELTDCSLSTRDRCFAFDHGRTAACEEALLTTALSNSNLNSPAGIHGPPPLFVPISGKPNPEKGCNPTTPKFSKKSSLDLATGRSAAMGICFSKKKGDSAERGSDPTAVKDPPRSSKRLPSQTKGVTPAAPKAAASPSRKQIFVAVPGNEKKAQPKGSDKEAATGRAPTVVVATPATSSEKKPPPVAGGVVRKNGGLAISQDDDTVTASAVRTSSCTKEEVESILIQCGRLSRNSSAVEDEFRRSRKRSFDFDCVDRASEEDKEKLHLNKASPRRHRRTPSRDRDRESDEQKRSVSRGRRLSRSPARRAESPVPSAVSQTTSAIEKTRQNPGKLISVPPREKVCLLSETGAKKAPPQFSTAEVGTKLRSASPRSRSPANCSRPCNENAHSLSRSSSRKAEQSPHRRNPMTEVDGNIVLRVEQPSTFKSNQMPSEDKIKAPNSRKPDEGTKKPQKSGDIAATPQHRNAVVEATNVISCGSNTGSRCSKGKDEQEETTRTNLKGEVIAALASNVPPGTRLVLSRSRSSRRSSRDLDVNSEALPNHSSYASLLLEDIQNYHQQAAAGPPAASVLPACVAKANAIIEAVADLNAPKHGKTGAEFIMATEEAARDDLMKPTLRKNVSCARDGSVELEPQESAGSNSFVGNQTWISSSSSPCEPTCSVDSADRSWTSSRVNTGPEEPGTHRQKQQRNLKLLKEERERRKRPDGAVSKTIGVNVV
ncbi:uncharacterized protein LOC144716439 [Wolffia australiana]